MKILKYIINKIKSIILMVLIYLYLILIFVSPFELTKYIYYSEIFPAIDLGVLYFISNKYRVKYWHLFIVGFFFDKLYSMPLGTNSLILILSQGFINYLRQWFLIKKYTINIMLFIPYCFNVIISRYIIVTIYSRHYIEIESVLFYILTTILSYPLIFALIDKPLKNLRNNAQ